MKILKLDLMTVLFIVVAIGVVVTMSTQASTHALNQSNDFSVSDLAKTQVSVQTVDVTVSKKH